MNHFFYNLNTQFENTGDLLINKSLVELLAKRGIVYIDDYGKPPEFMDSLFQNDNVKRLSLLPNQINMIGHIKKRIKNKNTDDKFYLVFVPGDMSRAKFRSALSGIKNFKNLLSLNLSGVRILRLGVSLGKFNVFSAYIEAISSLTYRSFAVRDTISMEIAKRFHFSHLSFFPDLAWAYDLKDKPEKHDKKEYIVLSFRSNERGTIHNGSYILKIVQELQQILQNSDLSAYKIKISYQVGYDRQAANDIYGILNKYFDVELIDKKLDIVEASALYRNAQCVISNRLHVLLLSILADSLAIPYINRNDNRKIHGIFNDNELTESILFQEDENLFNAKKTNNIMKAKSNWITKYRQRKEINSTIISNSLDTITA
jgi:polysaccharide pyruvyl transferase WcaK-like protein